MLHVLGQPVPRFLWDSKPYNNVNQDMTEVYVDEPFSSYGSILLFTPLGEALYYFGYFGLVIIPFLYGFTIKTMSRLYRSSPA
jgi:hypothetical protein